jgi:hypothetical protein
MLTDGYTARGEGAHEAEVSYLLTIQLTENTIRLLNELRANRNGILYYGENLSRAYAEQAVELADKFGPILRKECKKRNIL